MEIEQFLYDLNDSGDAVVGYTMTSANGGVVQLCNLGASVLSYEVDGVGSGSILEGRCVRSTDFGGPDDLIGGVKFDEMLWESRVETNRVVMSLNYGAGEVGFMLEVVFDFDDDNTFEITYIGCLNPESNPDIMGIQFDLMHSFSSPLKVADMCDLEGGKDLYRSSSAKPNILSRVMVLEGGVEVLSSQPQVGLSDGGFVLLTTPQRPIGIDDRRIQKSVFRIVK